MSVFILSISTWYLSPSASRHCSALQDARSLHGQLPRWTADCLDSLIPSRCADARDLPPHCPALGGRLWPADDAHIAAHHVEIKMEANCCQRTGNRRDEEAKVEDHIPAEPLRKVRRCGLALPCSRLSHVVYSSEERDRPGRLDPYSLPTTE